MDAASRWRKVKSLLNAALDEAPAQRAAVIDCSPEDESIRLEASRLLSGIEDASDFLSNPPGGIASEVLSAGIVPARTGDLIAERFRIARLLGRGGMGYVYEAEDLRTATGVALKMIRAQAAGSVANRIREELVLARAVTHRNVCRIFDLHVHEGSVVLNMELIRGETLAERLARGTFEPAGVYPLARQLASALAAVHACGIAHGDLKCSNVMLSPEPDGSCRVVLMDFGIAVEGKRNTASAPAHSLGTPRYMSPEQLSTGPTPAADIYAFGMLMTEAVAGTRSAASRRMQLAIARCLQANPAKRFQDGTDLSHALAARRNRGVLAAVAVAVLVTAASAALLLGRREPTHLEVTVLGFSNETTQAADDYLGAALELALDASLSADRSLEVASAQDVSGIRASLKREASSQSLPPGALRRLRSGLGSDLVISGSYRALSLNQISVRAGLHDARTGTTVALVSEQGPASNIPAIAARMSLQLIQKMGRGAERASQSTAAADILPHNADAMHYYAEGVRRLRAFDALDARDLLERSVAIEPRFPLAHSALAEAFEKLGYERLSLQEAQTAFRLRASLNYEQRLSIQGRYYDSMQQQDKAAAAYRELLRLRPNNVDDTLLLAGVQPGREALVTLAQLRRSRSAETDPRIDLAEAKAAREVDDFERQRACAVRAATAATRNGDLLLVAEARLYEGWAAGILGRPRDATAAYERARVEYEKVGELVGVGRSLRGLAKSAQYEGDLPGALVLYRDALEIFQRVGSLQYVALALNGIATVDADQGHLQQALTSYRGELDICTQVADPICEATALNNMGYVLFREGRVTPARERLTRAVAQFRETKARYGESFALSSMADLLEAEGDLSRAEERIREALGISRSLRDRQSEAQANLTLASILRNRGLPAEALKLAEAALKLQNELGERDRAAQAHLMLARIALDVRDYRRAATEVSAALPSLERAGRREEVAIAQALLAQTAALEGREEEARRGLAEALRSVEGMESRLVQIQVLICAGRTERLLNDERSAGRHMAEARREAHECGFALFERQSE